MNLPTYKDIMVPALQLLSATDVIRKRDITAPLAEQLGLTDKARLAEYESGNGNIFEDRTSSGAELPQPFRVSLTSRNGASTG